MLGSEELLGKALADGYREKGHARDEMPGHILAVARGL